MSQVNLKELLKIANSISLLLTTLVLVACNSSSSGSKKTPVGDNFIVEKDKANKNNSLDNDVIQTTADGSIANNGSNFNTPSSTPKVEFGKLSINWTAPVARTDGTPISMREIGGYNVYFGKTTDEEVFTMKVNDSYQDSIIITDLPKGEYFIMMTAVDIDGRESDYSDEIFKQAL